MPKEPMPAPGHERVAEKALRDFQKTATEQLAEGYAKYGTRLMTFNGRSAYRDALQEHVDLLQYFTQLEMEREVLYQALFSFLLERYHGDEFYYEDELPPQLVEQLHHDLEKYI